MKRYSQYPPYAIRCISFCWTLTRIREVRENSKAAEEDRLSDNELLAQVNTFLFAGTDTTANSLSRILCMLSANPDAQDKLRKELLEVGAPDASLTYEVLDHLPFLDAVCRETLRLHAPVRLLHRM